MVHRHTLDKHVRFLGFQPQETLASFHRLSGAFVFPSLYQGFGLPTTPIAFVTEVLFPYPASPRPSYLERHLGSPAHESLWARLRAEHEADRRLDARVPEWAEAPQFSASRPSRLTSAGSWISTPYLTAYSRYDHRAESRALQLHAHRRAPEDRIGGRRVRVRFAARAGRGSRRRQADAPGGEARQSPSARRRPRTAPVPRRDRIDRNIDDVCQIIRNCARAGIPAVK